MESILRHMTAIFVRGGTAVSVYETNRVLFGVAVSALTLLIVAAGVIAVLLYLRQSGKLVSADHSSEIDEGTGLGNRYYLARRYSEMVKPSKRSEYVLCCIYADSDKLERNFKRDEMLKFVTHVSELVQTVMKQIRSVYVLARVPGYGLFVLVKKDSGFVENLNSLVREAGSYALHQENGQLSDAYRTAAGIYPLKAEDSDIHECIFTAYHTALAAYEQNEDLLVCDDEMVAMFSDERDMRREITRAFENREFVTYIQFFVDTMDNEDIVGGEALVRWNHPERGILSPINFVPFMEKEDLIPNLDYYNLEEVCRFIEEMYNNGIKNNFYISCNFSRKTFSSHDFVDRVKEIFKDFDFPKSMIAFEMTESENVKNIVQAYNNAVQIKELGVKILLDDFGEGFASFYDLTEYPVDGLKIDKALVDSIHTEKGNTILRGMTKMGHELNMKVIVEGVESDDQVNELKDIRCDIIQGFRFHRPIPVHEAKKTLADKGALPDGGVATA